MGDEPFERFIWWNLLEGEVKHYSIAESDFNLQYPQTILDHGTRQKIHLLSIINSDSFC